MKQKLIATFQSFEYFFLYYQLRNSLISLCYRNNRLPLFGIPGFKYASHDFTKYAGNYLICTHTYTQSSTYKTCARAHAPMHSSITAHLMRVQTNSFMLYIRDLATLSSNILDVKINNSRFLSRFICFSFEILNLSTLSTATI
jgi:hypothetical protein